jgi:phosphoribosylglycinamide formyltransferase 1
MLRIGVLASGSGSNFQALIESVESKYIPDVEIAVLISDKKNSYAIERARKHGIDAIYVDAQSLGRGGTDEKIIKELKSRGVGLVCLAGYMRIITKKLIGEFPNAVMNIHPALLPSFKGLSAQRQAFEYGVKIAGCTVHFVDEEVDNGPIILQAAVPVIVGDTEQALKDRILSMEHRIYPEAVKWFSEGRIKIHGRKVIVEGVSQQALGLREL